ncbi:MAG: DUF3800 domain-containing protein [Leptolinea sp.]
MESLWHAYLDESGTVGTTTGSNFLVVAALASNHPREIQLTVRRALKKFGKSLTKCEIKAANFKDTAILRLLQELSQLDISIVAVIVNQNIIKKLPQDAEDIYRWTVARTVYHLVERFPRLEINLDKRYTKESLRYLLEKSIRTSIEILPQKMVLIRQVDSTVCKELQAVDVIAWAFFQKYERSNSRFYDIIQPKIVVEESITDRDWKND